MKRILLALMTVLITLLAGVAAAPQACACSCVPVDPGQGFPDADLIAEVSVISVQRGWTTNTFTFQVHREWKGEHAPVVTVDSAAQDTACGVNFEGDGARYLLFASQFDGRLTTGVCSGSSRIDGADPSSALADVQAQLGRGTVPDEGDGALTGPATVAPGTARSWRTVALGGGAALALVAIGLLVVVVRRR